MDPKSFVSKLAGEVRKTSSGYWTFVPKPLPPRLEYPAELTLLLSQADAALSELSGLGRYLPNPDLLIQPYIRREAVASSRIEGTQAGISDLLFDEVEPKHTSPESDVREVRNYIQAMNRGLQRIRKLPLSGRLVRELHSTLMQNVRGQERTPGQFRRTQNWIGPPGSTLMTATYVPPPPDPEMNECLKHWEEFVNRRGVLPDLVQCALMHEHFEAIHPFLDGNGRIGRLLITLFLIERGRLSKPLLYLSSYIEQTRETYYELLQRVRTHGDWPAWLRYFLTAVRDTSRSAIEQSQAILKLRDEFRGRLAQQHRALALLDLLFFNPYVTVALASARLGASLPTARKTIGILENAGMLSKATEGNWRQVWLARPILKAVESSPLIRST
ncbi:MAG: Fic family protein [Phycisphaerales bacterium]|nr:Fic family protein [Phycisphaerales bacterium]